MSNTIKIRRGSGTPLASDFSDYELAYDYSGNKLYIKHSSSMVEVGDYLTTINNSNWSGTDLAIANGGTGGSTAAAARTNLGVDAAGTDNSTPVTIAAGKDYITISGQELTLGSVNLTTDVTGALPVGNGGTGATNTTTARSNLGLAIGTNVQAYDAFLQDIADLSPTYSEDGYVLTYEDASDSFVLSAAASGGVTSVATGGGLTGGTITSTGTISHADTSSASNLTASSRTYVTALTFDTYGHVTGYSTGTETVTDTNTTYSAGTGLALSGTTFNADFSEFTDLTTAMASTDEFIILDAGVEKRKAANEIGLSIFSNDTGYITGNQTITLSGDVSGSGTTSISVTVADDSHNHVISNVDGLQTALDGKLSTSGTAANSQLLDSLNSTQFLRSDANDTYSGTITFQAPTNGTGVFMTKAVDSPDEPAILVLAGDADSEDDLAFEIRGNGTGSSVDLSTTMSSTDTKFAVFQSGHTTIGYSSLGTSYSPVNAYGLNVNGTISSVNGYYAGSTQVINSSGNWVGGGNISEFTNDSGYVTTSGVTSVAVSAGTGLAGGGTVTSTGTISLSLNFAELTDMTGDISSSTEFILQNGTTESRKPANEIKLSQLNNDAGWTTNSGTVTSVATGGGLSGGTITSSGTISHADTSSASNLTASSRRYVTGLTFDTYGHVTGYTTGTETVTDTNTTYSGTDGVSLSGTTFRADSTVLRTDTTFGGDVSGAYNSIVVADDSHNHVISNVDGLQTALDGKLSTSGTAANSQLLDSIDSTGFTRAGVESGTPNTASNKTTFTCNDTLPTTSGNQSGLQVWQDTVNADAFMTFHIANDYAVYFGLDGGTNDLAVGGWSMGANSYKIWHEGNHGGGSGLNADKLDGTHGSGYLRSNVDDTFTGKLTGTSTAICLGYDSGSTNSFQCSNWFRSSGSSGWYNGTYGGGVYMTDTTWVRTYNSKSIYTAGTLAASGDVIAYYSDERLKTKIETIDNAVDKVMSLEGFIYEENELAEELGCKKKGKKQAGVSAQQVEKVLPEAVTLAPLDMETDEFSGEITSKSGENYLTVKYEKLVPLLIQAIKEQQQQINELKEQLNG